MFGSRGVELKTPDQLALMRESGLILAETLDVVRAAVAPGVTTAELDAVAEAHIRSRGATPNFKGYEGFPATICTSVNDVVVHGIPGDRVLREGDVISIDGGCIVEGWHSDSAFTMGVGEIDPQMQELLDVCEQALWRGIAAMRLGGRVGDIGQAVEGYVRSRGDLGVIDDYVGHGIGSAMHMSPDVPNVAVRWKGPKVVPGMALAIEPMLVTGGVGTRVLDDDWTVVTTDGGRAAHFEHSVTVTEAGVVVLTAHDGGAERLSALDVTCGV